eukprot:3454940-Prymnesium_polylepis.1
MGLGSPLWASLNRRAPDWRTVYDGISHLSQRISAFRNGGFTLAVFPMEPQVSRGGPVACLSQQHTGMRMEERERRG